VNKIHHFGKLATAKKGRFAASFVKSEENREATAGTKTFLHGTSVAMYIVGQERRLVNPPSQVVAGVRTVTTNMNGRDALPRMSRPFAFLEAFPLHSGYALVDLAHGTR